jgi:uncharacterized membrane protein YhaH (DUF805 family)
VVQHRKNMKRKSEYKVCSIVESFAVYFVSSFCYFLLLIYLMCAHTRKSHTYCLPCCAFCYFVLTFHPSLFLSIPDGTRKSHTNRLAFFLLSCLVFSSLFILLCFCFTPHTQIAHSQSCCCALSNLVFSSLFILLYVYSSPHTRADRTLQGRRAHDLG